MNTGFSGSANAPPAGAGSVRINADIPDDIIAREFAEMNEIKVEKGVEYDGLSKAGQEWIERRFDSPTTLYDENVPWRFWKLVASMLTRMMRSTTSDSLRDAREICRTYARSLAKNRVNAMTPFRSQLDLFDMLSLRIPDGTPDAMVMEWRGKMDEVLRAWREVCYIAFNNEYLARRVG